MSARACWRLIGWNTVVHAQMDNKLSRIYYSPKGYWKGIAAIRKLPLAANASEKVARAWLQKQSIWQTYPPASLHVLRPK